MENKAKKYRTIMEKRRSYRHFSPKPIPKEVIIDLLMTASTAPSGANKQPWFFCAVSSPEIKKQIRNKAEKIEYNTYQKMSTEWKKDLAHLNTNWKKEFLETAPWIIVVFKKTFEMVNGKKNKNYYVNESVGLATGILLSAIHNAGFVSLTYTPSPMNFLSVILNRPEEEKPYMVIPIGYPAKDAFLPELSKKQEESLIKFY